MQKLLGTLTIGGLAMQTWRYIEEHELMTRSYAIAFAAMLAGIPFMMLLFTVCSLLLPDVTQHDVSAAGYVTAEQFRSILQQFLPDVVYGVVADQIARIQTKEPFELISISLGMTIWMASSLQMNIICSLNIVYGVKETRPYWRQRLQAFYMTFVQIAVLFAGVVAFLDAPMVLNFFGIETLNDYVATGLKWLTVVSVLMGSFAFTFHMGPDSAQKKRWVTPGSLFGAISFVISSIAFRAFVEHFGQYGKVYGCLVGLSRCSCGYGFPAWSSLIAAEINRLTEYAAENRHPKQAPADCTCEDLKEQGENEQAASNSNEKPD